MKHKSVARNLNSIPYKSHLYSSMNKYGIENFTFEILEECNYSCLDDKERYWISKLNTLEPNGYNIKNGGRKLFKEDNPFYGKHHNEETKRIISEKNKGRKASDEEKKMRRRINKGKNNPFYGKTHSLDTINKIRESNIKNGNYQKSSERMKKNNPNDGTLFSKVVIMFDNKFNILNLFESATKVGEYIKMNRLSNAKVPSNSISDVCRGKQKTAFSFIWRYITPTFKNDINTRTVGFIIAKKRR